MSRLRSAARMRHVARLNPPVPEFLAANPDEDVTFVPLEAVWPGGRLDVSRLRPKGEVDSGYTRFAEGDILIPKITPTFEADRSTLALGLRNGFGCGTTELHVLRAGPQLNARFASYVVSSRIFLLEGTASMIGVAGQRRVPESFIENFEVQLRALDEQRTIADSLDAETARIDALVNWYLKLKPLLIERWRTELQQAMSGHMRAPIRRVVSMVTSGPRGWAEYAADSGELFIRITNLQRDSLSLALRDVVRVDVMPTSEALRSRTEVGDVLLAITADVGAVGVVDETASSAYVSQHVCLLRPYGVDPRWLGYALLSPDAKHQRLAGQYGGSKQQLSLGDVREVNVAVPPLAVQVRLAGALRVKESLMQQGMATIDRQVALLKERRQALITAAVTREIDVSTASGRGVPV